MASPWALFLAVILLAGPERLESGWWSLLSSAEAEGDELALRDYYVARSPHAGLLWVYRRRNAGGAGVAFCWGSIDEFTTGSVTQADPCVILKT